MNPSAYNVLWTRRISDDWVTVWLCHDGCGEQVEGWDATSPTLAELNTAADIHGLTCPDV